MNKNDLFSQYKKFREQGGRPTEFLKVQKHQDKIGLAEIVVKEGRGNAIFSASWVSSGFNLAATVEPDLDYNLSYLGEFTDKYSKDCFRRRNVGRNDYKYFLPAQSYQEIFNFYHQSGYCRREADLLARKQRQEDWKKAEGYNNNWWGAYAVLVTASKEDITLGRSSLCGIEFGQDAQKEFKEYCLELELEVVEQAQDVRSKLCNCNEIRNENKK